MQSCCAVVGNKLVRWPLFFCLLGLAGCAALDPGATRRLNASEKMVWSTYAIGTRHGFATCVVVDHKGTSSGRKPFPVLITSAHVLSVAPRGPFYLVLRQPAGIGEPAVAVVEFQPSGGVGPAYIRHPDCDIAAIALPLSAEVAEQLSLPSFLSEKEIGIRADRPRVGDDISMLGFPEVLPGTPGAFPVLRAGRIASYSAAGRSDGGRFLVNTNVYPGDSGAPVFRAQRHGRPRLIGMVTERIGPRAGAVPLAVAIDATAIRETLQLLDERDHQVVAAPRRSGDPSAKSTVKLLGALPKWLRQASEWKR